MGILRRIDRRSEARTTVDMSLMVWGVDTKGERFMQEARARDISRSGALLTGLDADLRSGDVIGILCGNQKARFRVVWTRYDAGGEKMQVAVHRVDPDVCPWKDLLSEEESSPRSDQASPELRGRATVDIPQWSMSAWCRHVALRFQTSGGLPSRP